MDKFKVGISSCLLGEEVRYNGKHKRSPLCTGALSAYFDYVPLCPEVSIGLGVPRQPIHLVGEADTARAVGVEDARVDVTDELERHAQAQSPLLDTLAGYILMQDSPSCGLHQVKLYDIGGAQKACDGRGIFARTLTQLYPLLPVEEAGRLQDRALRENFLLRVFAYADWQETTATGLSPAALVQFHSRYKYTLMAHHPPSYKQLGQWVATVGAQGFQSLCARYFAGLMQALSHTASRKNHTNVLMHLQGYLKKSLQPEQKRALAGLIDQYRDERAPLSAPVSLLKQHFDAHPDAYAAKQVYLAFYSDVRQSDL